MSPQTILPVPGGRAATSYTLTNLKVDQSYLVAVRPVSGDAAGSTTTVGEWTYGTDVHGAGNYTPRQRTPAKTSQPQGVEVNGSDESLTVTWRKDGNANNYLVEWRQRNQSYDNPNQQMTVAQPSSGTTVEAVIDDLPNWWTYRVRVTARNERGPGSSVSEYKSAPSAEATDQTRDTDYWAAPNPVEAVAGDGEVMVKWTAVEDATGYRVQWRTASQSYDSSRQHDGFYQYRSGDLQLNHTVDDLENGTEYMFRVFAKFGDGDMSQPSDEVKAMPMIPTPALPVFGALVLGAGLVAAGWRRLRARRLLDGADSWPLPKCSGRSSSRRGLAWRPAGRVACSGTFRLAEGVAVRRVATLHGPGQKSHCNPALSFRWPSSDGGATSRRGWREGVRLLFESSCRLVAGDADRHAPAAFSH